MKRFENAEVGDKVYSAYYDAYGEIVDISSNSLSAAFPTIGCVQFTIDGFEQHFHKNQSLYYVDEDGTKCNERPEQPIDWDKVEPGTKFKCKSHSGNKWSTWYYRFYNDGTPWFDEHENLNSSNIKTFKYIRRPKCPTQP